MQVYFEYLLKVSVCHAIVFLFYTLLLKRITWYSWNRYFLIVFSLLAFIIPFVDVSLFSAARPHEAAGFIHQIPLATGKVVALSPATANSFNYLPILSMLYFLTAFVLAIRLLIQLFSIKNITSKATLVNQGDVNIYHLSEPVLPFSFFNNIFVNVEGYSSNELKEIINHEQIHAKQNHTLDILLVEAICIINCCNPFVWLIKKAVRENLEFIADDAVIQKGVNKANYQYLLLKVNGDIPFSVASNFKFSSLKNRIVMMNKAKTPGVHLLKFTLLIPMIVFLSLAFGTKRELKAEEAGTRTSREETFTLSKLTYAIPDNKVKAVVFKESDKCLLKPGEQFDLLLVSNEKNRLKNLLEQNGFNNINNGAITFLIDSSSANHSFAVQVNINLQGNTAAINRKSFSESNREKATTRQVSADLKKEIWYNFPK